MQNFKCFELIFLILTLSVVQICCIFIPESHNNNNEHNNIDTVKLPKQQQHNINHLTEINAFRKQQKQQHHRHHQLETYKLKQQKTHEKSYDKNNDVVDIIYNELTNSNTTTAIIKTTSTAQLPTLEVSNATEQNRQKRQLSDFLIVPNTRWCGRGNTANGTYNHLGGASLADKCCRRHDNCQLFIPGMSNRYDLFNYRPYTLSHCNCDRRFHTCLKLANDDDAKTIGKLFFNIVQTQCFVLRNEKVCQQRAPDGNCMHEIVKQKAYFKQNKKF